ncbi:hypothetical protein SmJEL517_g00377 [Synchytrium microbalum]|uniref:Sorting nexin MVP1 n=1 Tax=Synchytrium microbalum TaxID=1806994 RepID=A0A507CJU8_9FUNG|nr:uncharacterized protein SmJEL517_g00377 [Synchytrium microbalum]TPX38135.1 hypothetical protein SmJEL517_g00377 [Synchytrium microbalum]
MSEDFGPLAGNDDFAKAFAQRRISSSVDPWNTGSTTNSNAHSPVSVSQTRTVDLAASMTADDDLISAHLSSSNMFERPSTKHSNNHTTDDTSPSSTSTGPSSSIESDDPWSHQGATPARKQALIASKPVSVSETEGYVPSSPPSHNQRHVEFGGVSFAETPPQRPHVKSTKLPDLTNYVATAYPVKVMTAPEKGGVVFKHVQYVVECSLPPARVLRRYSDFVWLLDVLSKRYAFRSLPSLPPKKVNAQSDEAFLERRRRGLARFSTFIVNHPVLKEDVTVGAFLQYGSDIATYKKGHNLPIDEEYVDADFGPAEMDSLPSDLDDRLASLKGNLDFLSDQYKELCTLMEKISRRADGSSQDFMRFGFVLNALTEKPDCQEPECFNCPQINHGFSHIAGGLQKISRLMEEEASSTFDGVLESLKAHRDLLISLQELFQRRDKAIIAQHAAIDALKKRMTQNDTKAKDLASKGGQQKEVERLENCIIQDRHELEWQSHKIDFIRFACWQEMTCYHARKGFVSGLYQNYVRDQVKYSQQMSSIWEELGANISELPTSF